jgi:hypothetical protein
MSVKEMLEQYLDLHKKLDDITGGIGAYDDMRPYRWQFIDSKYSDRHCGIRLADDKRDDTPDYVSIDLNRVKRIEGLVFAQASLEYGEGATDYYIFILDESKEMKDAE